MTPRGDDRPDDGNDFDLEVIELEPTEPAKRRSRESSTTAGARHRRVPVVIAIVVLAGLVGSVIAGRSHGSNRSRPTTLPKQISGTPVFPFRVGAQLLTAGQNGLHLVDTDTGRVTAPQIEGLPAGPTTIIAHSGGTVAVRIDSHLYWFTMQNRIAHFVDATTAFPDARSPGLWLADPRSATLVPPPPLPGRASRVATSGPPIGATRGGLLIATKGGVLLEPTESTGPTRLLLPAPATVIGVHPDRVAWVANDCRVLQCPVHVTEVATGASSSWLQLVDHPSPLVVAGSSATFSPDGNYLAIALPDNSVITAETLVVADLRSRVTTNTSVRGRLDQPARPGTDDATGMTIDWAPDSRYLLLSPSGLGRVQAIDATRPQIVSSRTAWGSTTTAAVVGISSVGPLDFPRRNPSGPVDSGGPTQFGTPGLSILGTDDQQVDAVDIADNRLSTWPVRGALPDPADVNTIAPVTGGWLVVRDAGVFLLRDGGGEARTVRLGAGSQVFSSRNGRDAWIAVETAGLLWTIEPYDPATGAIGPAVTLGAPVGAVDDGLLVTGDTAFLGSAFDLVDRSGHMHSGPAIDSRSIRVLRAAGTHVALLGSGGLFVLDLASGTNRLITNRAVFAAALSSDGEIVGWIESDASNPKSRHVMATRVDGNRVAQLGGPGDRVLVADDGTVVFTSGGSIRAGRVDADGSDPVYGFAPGRDARLALRFDPPPANINLGPNFLP